MRLDGQPVRLGAKRLLDDAELGTLRRKPVEAALGVRESFAGILRGATRTGEVAFVRAAATLAALELSLGLGELVPRLPHARERLFLGSVEGLELDRDCRQTRLDLRGVRPQLRHPAGQLRYDPDLRAYRRVALLEGGGEREERVGAGGGHAAIIADRASMTARLGCVTLPVSDEGRGMHARMATYRFSGDAHELAQKAEQGILPIFQAQPGFRAYSVATDGDEILSLSVWDSRAEAEAGNAAAADWVRDNMADNIELIGTRFPEVLFSTSLGISTLAGATA